ncbi:FMN binding protein [Aureococcus anophagefferens]|nr:FMN binding protein [Aureococcus anophagefferens]
MSTPETPPAPAAIGAPLELRCGLTLRNRLCKAATSEHLGTPRTNDATPRLVRLYERWGAGGFGLIITGNVMVCRCALEAPRNVVVDAATDGAAVAAWAAAARRRGAVAIAQLSHPGRQSPVAASWARPRAPSAVPLRLAGVGPPLHRSPVAMAPAEVEEVVEAFGARAVPVAAGQRAARRLRRRRGPAVALMLACRAARRAMGPGKLLAVKVNASDFEAGGFDRDGAAAVVRALAADEARVDVIELRGNRPPVRDVPTKL